jgi:ribonucleoside-diphosphate reductase alpha chain
MEWAQGETDMAEAVAQFVEGLTAKAQAAGLVKDVRGRTRFRDDLTAGFTAGVLAIGHPRSGRALRVVDAGSPEIALAVAQHRGEAAAQAAALELERRLQAVMDAVLRCEGDADACADPARNPGLARAADAARSAGAPDAMIFEAIALARSGESGWEIVPPAVTGGGVRLVVAGAADVAVARAAWATGAVVLATERRRNGTRPRKARCAAASA